MYVCHLDRYILKKAHIYKQIAHVIANGAVIIDNGNFAIDNNLVLP